MRNRPLEGLGERMQNRPYASNFGIRVYNRTGCAERSEVAIIRRVAGPPVLRNSAKSKLAFGSFWKTPGFLALCISRDFRLKVIGNKVLETMLRKQNVFFSVGREQGGSGGGSVFVQCV